jgi:hypothetical protein
MVLQKIEHVCGSISLDDQGHSPRPRGEDLLWQLYAYDRLQYGNPALRSLNFPLTPVNGLAGKERREATCTQKLQSKD